MVLPTNGKVVVLDDKILEVRKLLAALSSKGIPFHYFQDEFGEDLPEKPINNVRLIFLDLLLHTEGDESPKNVISVVASRLKKILKPDNGPYILIYWSTEEDRFREELEKAFNGNLEDYKPFILFSLSKGKNVKIEQIKEELNSHYDDFKSLKAFIRWENMINDSAGDIVNDFTSFFEQNSEWDENLKAIIYKLARGNLESHIDSKTDKEILVSSLLTLSKVLNDTIETKLATDFDLEVGEIKDQDNLDDDVTDKINTKIHVSDSYHTKLYPGNVYELNNGNHFNIIDLCRKSFNDGKLKNISDINPVLLNVTANCDFAQKKVGYIRLLPGIMVEKGFMKYQRESVYRLNSQYTIYPFCHETNHKFVIFDSRYLKSLPKEDNFFKESDVLFRLRNEMLVDIQAHISNQINRPGIISVF